MNMIITLSILLFAMVALLIVYIRLIRKASGFERAFLIYNFILLTICVGLVGYVIRTLAKIQ